MTYHVIKWTWFHRNFRGKNRVVQNTIVDWAVDVRNIRRWFADRIDECVRVRGFSIHKRTENCVVFITRSGDYVNMRMV